MGGIASGGGRACRQVFQVQSGKAEAFYLVFQLQNNALGQLGPHAVGPGKTLRVPRRRGQGHVFRGHFRENGQGGLGPHAADGRKQLIAVELPLGVKAVQVQSVLPHIEIGIKGGLAAGTGQGPQGAHGGQALKGHASHINDRHARLRVGQGAGQTIKHVDRLL